MKLRRTLAILLALLMLPGALPALAATSSTDTWCDHALDGKHSWGEWTVTRKATCTKEGERTRECVLCSYVQTEKIKKLKHDYGKWKTTKEATCTKEGEQVRKCKVCKHEEKRKVDKLPHDYGEWTVTQEATCTETGTRTRTCKTCGHVDNGTIKKLPHTWGEWAVAVEATDHSPGTRARACQVCGTEETENFDPEGTLRRGAKGDDVRALQEGLICYGALTGRADGAYGKGTERAVRRLQEAEGLAVDGVAWPLVRAFAQHRFGEWQTVSKLTRTTDGVRERTCERCGLVERDVVEAKPVIKRGDRGDAVRVIQQIIWDLGYRPGKIDGVYGPKLDAAVADCARDHDWYYEPGLLKPIDIDRIVGAWTDAQERRIGISGANTPVSLQIEVTRDFPMLIVTPGQSLKYSYTVTNVGTEDCTLGPLFVSFNEIKSYQADKTYFRYVGDLGGALLKAGGANTYTGSFSVSADMDRAVLTDPQIGYYELFVNAWVLGTSKADGRKWYSNIDQTFVRLDDDSPAVDPGLALTGRVLNEQEWYTLGDEFEFEGSVRNDTGKALRVYITGIGRTWEGAEAITGDDPSVVLAPGETLTKSWSHRLSAGDEIRDGKFGFWLEAYGFTEADEPVSAPQVPLSVNVRDPYQLAGDALVLTRASDDPEGTHYPAGETWRYRYRVANRGDVVLHDVRIQAFINDLGDWRPLDALEPGALGAGAHADLEGARAVGTVYASRDYEEKDESGKWISGWSYIINVIAEGVTPDGETVYAKPIRDRIPIDFEGIEGYSLPKGLALTGAIAEPKDEYVDGDEVELEVMLKNLSGEPLTAYAVEALLGPDFLDDTYGSLGGTEGDGALGAGETWTKTFSVKLRHLWDTDDYHLMLKADGSTGDGFTVESNAIYIPVTVLAGDNDPEKHSNFPDGPGKLLRSGLSLRNLGDGPDSLRSLVVVDQSKVDADYFDGAEIPVYMRLHIDDMDAYTFKGIEVAPGDRVDFMDWTSETLEPGFSYDFVYTMALDPEQTGWNSRNVIISLVSESTGREEFESCDVHPLFRDATVTVPGLTGDRSATLTLDVKQGEYQGLPAAGEDLDIPFNASSGGNTYVQKVKLAWEQKEGKAVVNKGEVFLRDRMDPGDSLDLSRKIPIVGITGAPYEPEFTLRLTLTGTYMNKKGNQETVESEPFEIPLTVRDGSEAARQLALSGWVEPKKNAYASSDAVKIHLRVENHTGVTLENVAVTPAWPYGGFSKELMEKGRFQTLQDGEQAEAVLDYTVAPGDVQQGKIEMLFKATGRRQDNAKTAQSLNAPVTLPVDDVPQQALTLSVTVKNPRESYAPGSKVNVELAWRNGPLTSARFYAVGDNSAPSDEYGGDWHSFGHGVKGYKIHEESDVAAIMGWHRYETTVQIPADFKGEEYRAAWIIEGDREEAGLHKTVRSNLDTLILPIGAAPDEKLTLGVYQSIGVEPKAAVGDMVIFRAVLNYEGAAVPESYTVRYRPVGAEAWSTVKKATNNSNYVDAGCAVFSLREEDLSGDGWTYEFEAFATDRPALAAEPATYRLTLIDASTPPAGDPGEWPDGIEGDGAGPGEGPDGIEGDGAGPEDGIEGDGAGPEDGDEGPDGLPGDEPVPDWVDDGDGEPEESGAPLEDVSLNVDLLTPCPNPTGDWYGGEKVKFAVTASYNSGPEVPVRIEVCVTDAVEIWEPLKVMSANNTGYLADSCEITLDASHKVNDQCVYDFVAYVYLYDEDHVDYYSETVPWIFDMAPGGKGPDAPKTSPAPVQPAGAEVGPATLRSLTVIDQAKDDDAYYDGAKIPVRMRLTIDSMDSYRFAQIAVAPGDSVADLEWVDGDLLPGQSYDFTYNMALDPDRTGWKPRDVRITLSSNSTGKNEYESCEVRPPWAYSSVSFEDPNDAPHIINDNAAWLYLTVNPYAYHGKGYAGGLLDIPFNVDSDGNTDIRDLRLVVGLLENGAEISSETFHLRDRIAAGATFDASRQCTIKGEAGRKYALSLVVTGEYSDLKGAAQQVESQPVELPLEVYPDDNKGLVLDSYILPKKNRYSVNDLLHIHLNLDNMTGTELTGVTLGPAWPSTELDEPLKGKGVVGPLKQRGQAFIVADYRVRPEDVARGTITFEALAKGVRADDGQVVQSLRTSQTISIADSLDETLALTATVLHPLDAYAPGSEVAVRLGIKNPYNSLLQTDVYAVGQNSAPSKYLDDNFHDFGHGVKGYQYTRISNIPAGKTGYEEAYVTIPEDYAGGTYRAAWRAEGNANELGLTVQSNVAELLLPVGQPTTDEHLALSLGLNDPTAVPHAAGETVDFDPTLVYTGANPPKGYTFRYRLAGETNWRKTFSDDWSDGYRAGVLFECELREEDMSSGGWIIEIEAFDRYNPDRAAEPLVLYLSAEAVDEPVEGASIYPDLILNVQQLTESSHENDWWEDGDEVKVRVTAAYPGEETPKSIFIQMNGAVKNTLPLWSTSIAGAKECLDEFTLTIDASDAVGGQCAYTFEADASIEDSEVPDCFAEPKILVFDLAPSGAGPEGSGAPATQINWAAIDPAKAAEAVDGGVEAGEATETVDGAEATVAEVVDGGVEASEATETVDGIEASPTIETEDSGAPEADSGDADGEPGCEETVVTIHGADYDIPATVCVPAGEGPFPAVVMLHGTGSTRDEAGDGYRYAAPVLAEKYGIATIRIDFPGNGDSTADYMQYTFKSAVADAKAAADYMAAMDAIDGDAIGVMGWSQGGTDALLACAWEPETFKSIVTWAGAPDMMLDGFFSEEDYAEAKANGYFVMEFDWRENLNVSLQWCDDVANTDVLAEFADGYDGPVLAIAGTDDDTVDPEWSERIVAASGHEKSRVCFIEGMDHTFNVFAEEDLHSLYEAVDATGAFFAETLG